MGRTPLVIGVGTLVVLSFIAYALASESTVLYDAHRELRYGGLILNNSTSTLKNAPEDPQTVYISIVAPNVRLKRAVKSALANVTRAHGLRPVYVNEPITDYDLKGRIVIVYLPTDFWRDEFIHSEYGVSGILYYSYPGDAKTFVELDLSRNVSKETKETIEKFALELNSSSVRRLNEEYILNQTVSIAYWWNLRAVVGKLRKGDPYRMIAQEIAAQLDEFLENS